MRAAGEAGQPRKFPTRMRMICMDLRNARCQALLVLLLAMAGSFGSPTVSAHDFGGATTGSGGDSPPPQPPCDDGIGCPCPSGPGNRSSSPVSYLTGSESIRETDLMVDGVFPIAITRQYDSQSSYDSALGYGWTLLLDQ